MKPKTLAIGGGSVAAGVGGGVAIQKSFDKNSDKKIQDTPSINTQTPDGVSNTKDVNQGRATIKQKMQTAGFTLKEEKATECNAAIEAIPTLDSNNTQYKEAVLKCIENKDVFKSRASQLSLTIITSASDVNKYKAKWQSTANSNRQAAIKTISSAATENTPLSTIGPLCATEQAKQISVDSETTWTNFILACAEEGSNLEAALKKNFWTGEAKQ